MTPADGVDISGRTAETCSWPAPEKTNELSVLPSEVYKPVQESAGGSKPTDSHNDDGD
jgi:hypothetical protein